MGLGEGTTCTYENNPLPFPSKPLFCSAGCPTASNAPTPPSVPPGAQWGNSRCPSPPKQLPSPHTPARLHPPKWGSHPWKRHLLHQHPEVLNCPPPAEAFVTRPKPWGAVRLCSISPAYRFSSNLWGLTIPQIRPLQV